MSMRPQWIDDEIPEWTAKAAKASFPKGNRYMQMRDELGSIFKDEQFTEIYPERGQPAKSPWQLALVTVMQFGENLTDRQAADAVRARIDWKYALGLELTDAGFNYSVLSEFRQRLLTEGAEDKLFNQMLELFKERKLLNKKEQRTDATHIVAAIRDLNRLEIVGETLRSVLNKIAQVAPEWLKQQVTKEWFQRYSQPMVNFRLPKDKKEREQMQLVFGEDGRHLLSQLYAITAPSYLQELPEASLLRQVWVQQFHTDVDGQLHWRGKKNVPPARFMILSPYDAQARYSEKRGHAWRGYKVHLTETHDQDTPNLITNVQTTVATTHDSVVLAEVHTALEKKALAPEVHLVDSAYISGGALVDSAEQQIELLGPAHLNTSWQTSTKDAYAQTVFSIDWEQQVVTCPQKKQSIAWKSTQVANDKPAIQARFDKESCAACSARPLCTRSQSAARILTFHPRPQFEALAARRVYQKTDEFKQRFKSRAGVEGTISNAVFTLGMRRNRYLGLAKTHLQHLATASAINLQRGLDWLSQRPRSQTRLSHFGRLAVGF